VPRVTASSNLTTPTAALNDSRGRRRLTCGVVATLPARVEAIAHAARSETTAQDDGRSSAAPASALSFFPPTGCQLTANRGCRTSSQSGRRPEHWADARSLRITLACWMADVCRAAAAWGAGAGGAVDSCGHGLRSCRLARERRRLECLPRPVPALAVGSDAPDRLPARRPARPRPRRVMSGLPRSLRPPRRDVRTVVIAEDPEGRPVGYARSTERNGLAEFDGVLRRARFTGGGCRSRVARHCCASDREDRRQHGRPLTGGERLTFGHAINGRSPNQWTAGHPRRGPRV
jgi:hypothetical protein